MQVLLAAGSIAAVVFGWRHMEGYLARYTSGAAGHVPTDASLVVMPTPPWMNPQWVTQMRYRVAAQAGTDPMDAHGLQRAILTLAIDPWIERVERVQRLPEGRLFISAQFRRPVAVVEKPDGYRLVSEQGVRLPGLYVAGQLTEVALPVIVGASEAVPQEGRAWQGKDIKAGLSLVRWLGQQPYWGQVRAIDVSGRDSRGRIHLVLRTQRGSVQWGLPPGTERTIEPNAATKTAWLGDVYRQRGAIDAGGNRVDVFGPAVFIHPTAQQQAVSASYTNAR